MQPHSINDFIWILSGVVMLIAFLFAFKSMRSTFQLANETLTLCLSCMKVMPRYTRCLIENVDLEDRVQELLEANNVEVERRREAERKLLELITKGTVE